MSKVCVRAFTLSLDGFGAGPDQDEKNPLGRGGEAMHEWITSTRTFSRLLGDGDGTTGLDDRFTAESFRNVGAWIMGRNMFGPVRGPWANEDWKGWWGETPPFHVPVFVLTHHPRASVEMAGGTVFHFVTEGIGEALRRAREAAGDRDVRLGGGVATVRQFLEADLVDQMHLAFAPVLLGGGEAFFAGIDLPARGFEVVEYAASQKALHVVLGRRR